MADYTEPHLRRRAYRIRLPQPLPATLMRENGEHSLCKLQTVSVTGGLLQLPESLTPGEFVELVFRANHATVRGMAEMLGPLGAGSQPFRFVALDDHNHRALRVLTDIANDRRMFVAPSVLRGL